MSGSQDLVKTLVPHIIDLQKRVKKIEEILRILQSAKNSSNVYQTVSENYEMQDSNISLQNAIANRPRI